MRMPETSGENMRRAPQHLAPGTPSGNRTRGPYLEGREVAITPPVLVRVKFAGTNPVNELLPLVTAEPSLNHGKLGWPEYDRLTGVHHFNAFPDGAKAGSDPFLLFHERHAGIEPASPPWQGGVRTPAPMTHALTVIFMPLWPVATVMLRCRLLGLLTQWPYPVGGMATFHAPPVKVS